MQNKIVKPGKNHLYFRLKFLILPSQDEEVEAGDDNENEFPKWFVVKEELGGEVIVVVDDRWGAEGGEDERKLIIGGLGEVGRA